MLYRCVNPNCAISISGALFPLAGNCGACGSMLKPTQEFGQFQKVIDEKVDHQITQSEELLQQISDSVPGALLKYKLNIDGTDEVLYISDQSNGVWGVTAEEAMHDVGKLWARIHPEDITKMAESVAYSAENLSFWNQNWRICFDDFVRWVNGRGMPVRQADGSTVWNTILLDITELQSVKEDLLSLNSELEKRVVQRTKSLEKTNSKLTERTEELEKALNDLKATEMQLIRSEKMATLGALTAGVAHELNNPLNFIKGGATTIAQHLKEEHADNEDLMDMLAMVNEGVERVAGIVKSLNQFTRSSEKNNQRCNLHGIIDNCLTVLHNQTKNNITIERDYTEKPFEMIANEGKLHQLFLDIISNSIDAIMEKDLPQGTISITSDVKRKMVVVRVKDDGMGIKKSNLKKVTEPFFSTKQSQGTGLGLSISMAIVGEHHGKLALESEWKKGTEVTITLPQGTDQKNL